MKNGYFPATYWGKVYWPGLYWPSWGLVTAVVVIKEYEYFATTMTKNYYFKTDMTLTQDMTTTMTKNLTFRSDLT